MDYLNKMIVATVSITLITLSLGCCGNKSTTQNGRSIQTTSESRLATPDEGRDIDARRGARRIRGAIANGDITREEGRERLAILRERMGGNSDDDGLQSAMKTIGERIREAVTRGEITAEEGREKYESLGRELRKQMREQKSE